ncbi:MAG: hypothetical protein ACREQ5_01580 [Candidatus Dormibacteria bacterium]
MTLLWPFPSRNPQQEGRTDEGWDLVSTPGGPVLTVAPGTIHKAGPDPGGFGVDYPVQTLDQPITIGGKTFDTIYYGHTHMTVTPGHYGAGMAIARTGGGGQPLGGSGSPGEVEIGFGDPNKAGGISNTYGPLMKQALNGAGAASGGDTGGGVLGAISGAYNDLTNPITAVGDAITGAMAPFKVFLWFTQANHWVRIFAGGFGVVFVFFGVSMLAKEIHGNG